MSTNNSATDPSTNGFRWFNGTQFLGALNDNIYKLLIIFFLINLTGIEHAASTTATAGIVFVLPFLIFTPFAGYLADRLSKQRIIVYAKYAELLIMLGGLVSFANQSSIGLYATLFLMATQSSFFGPAKYGILPELVGRERLSSANGAVESLTYLAIILGTAAASLLPGVTNNFTSLSGVCVVIAVIGIITARKIPQTSSCQQGGGGAITEFVSALKVIASDSYLIMAVVGSGLFMFVAAFVQMNLIPYGIEELAMSQEAGGALFLVAAFGIGFGAWAAGKLSGRNVELGVAPVGAILLSCGALALGNGGSGIMGTVVAIFFLGCGGGLFIVPLHAFIQFRSPNEERGRILAASNLLGWIGVLLSAIAVQGVSTLGIDAAGGFLIVGLVTVIVSIITLSILPDFLLRFIGLVIMRLLYRVRTSGIENVPVDGGALLVANHVSWIDALLLVATQQRRIRFMMERSIYEKPILRTLCRLMKVIPVSSKDSRKGLLASLQNARAALDDGYIVCIFAEGTITRNGMLREFRPGFSRIVKGSSHPIIPVYIGGAWGSMFSYAHGKPFGRIPFRFPYPVTVSFGQQLAADATPHEVRQEVSQLSGVWFSERKRDRKPLIHHFVSIAKANPGRRAIADSSGKSLSYGHTLAGSLSLAGKLKSIIGSQKHVGILVPASVGGVLVNLALSLLGKIPVNLNFTASPEAFASAVEQCGITTIITSKRFLEKIDVELSVDTIFLEDILPSIGKIDKIVNIIKSRILPTRSLYKYPDFTPDDPATVIFSSGSTGTPKGVVLSHHNILSNIEGMRMVFRVEPSDNLCSALPLFHAFGFTAAFWLPLVSGFSAAYHPNPLEGAQIGKLTKKYASTMLFSTPTFLQTYSKRVKPDSFSSLRLVITGAERLSNRVADQFEERFGLRPLQGYGTTELAPVATLSLPDVRIHGVKQKGSIEGSVGQPLPGISIRVIDTETGEEIDDNSPGLIEISGPNVMSGYLNRPDLTEEAMTDGWYRTGDIGTVTSEGFLKITDRLSRFSKVGGEMVPHMAIEDVLMHDLDSEHPAVVVTAISDEKKGERIVVLYTEEAGNPIALHEKITDSELPNLWRPAKDAYIAVQSIPILGTGKLDLQGIKELASRETEGKRVA